MAEYTVSDIKGKGFKYEQYAQEQESETTQNGTFGCFIGTSNWGPINKPYIITGGSLEFKETFGYGGTRTDHGWNAASLHYQAPSALGIFARVADESTATRANLLLKNISDRPAIVIGNKDIRNGVTISTSNDSLSLSLRYKEVGGNVSYLDPLVISFNDYLSAPASLLGTLPTAGITIGTTTDITITIFSFDSEGKRSTHRIFSVMPLSALTIANPSDFINFIQNASYTTVKGGDGLTISPKPTLDTFFDISSSGNSIILTLKSLDYSFQVSDKTTVFKSSAPNNALKTPYVSILSAINNALNSAIDEVNNVIGVANYSFASINENGNLVLTGINNGEDSEIYIIESESVESLGLSVSNTNISGHNAGKLGTAIGTFRAKYRGVEGNTIKLRFGTSNDVRTMGIIFRNNLISTISDYNFDINSDYFIGTLIDNDMVANKVIKYDHAVTFYDFSDSDELNSSGIPIYQNDGETEIGIDWTIQDGIYSLGGGNSGENSLDLSYNILGIIEELKNLDLYQIDFIAVPGYEEESIQNALISLCTYRQDCFAFIDMPFITGTNTRNAVTKATKYINGTYIRSEKIDSIYAVLAFPYVRYRKRFYNSQNLLVSEVTYVSPTTILPYLYSLKDVNTNTSFDIAAGESYGGKILLSSIDFEGTQFFLSQEDRELLYADSYDACINPIAFNTQAGFFLDGQKTCLRKNLNGKLTGLSRISVMRTGLFIKKISHRISRQYFFAPIDPTTWKDFANRLNREIMQPLVSSRMIEPNYIVKCDAITNTDQVRNNNGMVAYIEFTPYKKLERIKVIANITETNTDLTIA
jgi:hypothetical protein